MSAGAFKVYSDEELALETQGGSLSAFDEIVRRHESAIFRFVRSRVRQSNDAEDIAQQTFVKAYQKINQFKFRYRFAPWLFTIARRLTIEHFRKNGGAGGTEAPEEFETKLPSDEIEAHESHRELWRQIRDLVPEQTATALWLKYEEQLSVAEIAKVIGRTTAHTKVILHRARKQLAEQLKIEQSIPTPPPLPAIESNA
ncbi:MAG: sigma-70 family RNA polymerase sigma factor [Verrucomicrobiota bacterium]